jgi:serine/arginine repetitive matrix protein 2
VLAIANLHHLQLLTNLKRSSRESSFDQLSTPDPESLPYLEKGPPSPLSDPDFSNANHHRLFAIAKEMKGIIKKEFDDENDEQEALRSEFKELYINWKRHILDLDRTRENVENALKQSSPEAPSSATAQELPTAQLQAPTEGGRRANRFATEYEMQRILELSLEEDRERRQKEREAKEAQANASRDREARIPDMLPPAELARRAFEDISQARQPRDAIRIFDFVPPPDDFTEEEDRLLRQEYATNIKAWGRIAKTVGNGRTYKECINHYYATKWDRPYEKKQRGRKGRRKGNKPLSGKKSALVPAGDTDMVDADGSTPLVTDSGRPRRAAAPQWPKDPDAEQGSLMPQVKKGGAGGKYEGGKDGEPGTDKPGRRKGTKEKAPRKARNQPLAARPTASSPPKTDKEGKDKIVPMPLEERAAVWEMSQLLQPQPQQLYAESGAVDILKAGVSAPTERARSHSQSQRQGASSYWSVVEEHDFRRCLEYFGTDFQAIANHMGSKTQTMVCILWHCVQRGLC